MRPERGGAVRVRAPARLHLGFLDLGGSLGRSFGSLGLALDRPATQMRLARAETDRVTGPDAARAAAARDAVRGALGWIAPLAIDIEHALTPHGGLGSGTQIALAVAAGIARLAGRGLAAGEAGRILGRGGRSAIGLHAFAGGGFILDGGRGAAAQPAPLLARLPFPETWRVLLVFDHARVGLSGAAEARAIAGLPPFSAALAAHLCHVALMQALPALAEGDIEAFGAALGDIQARLGDHYAAAQGGARFTSPDVAEAIATLRAAGLRGTGQSSWGPTGFAVIGSPAQAESLLQALRARYADRTNLEFLCARGNNSGADILDL
ncbi:beta-ribofuranosylaminobenzene 5'-phosphate synthase family protein [Aquabacter spiritensis]|uniref:Beta-RFAP synthase n=1 Tax=Aquabacter spiritensis TaxID=933073 RepID=A0A4R3LVT4_9HYPH|nr:beta-ribofuranosylaminobenzene 5'-phosphate synthase family protein [Aquabacter spiritensis]TCT04711.1 beta-RFAP synthase [Aquabacter spiritensis]